MHLLSPLKTHTRTLRAVGMLTATIALMGWSNQTFGKASDTIATRSKIIASVGFFEMDSLRLNSTGQLDRICQTIDSISNNGKIESLDIVATTSPDGNAAYNEYLSTLRARTLANHISRHTNLSDSIIFPVGKGEDWDALIDIAEQKLTADQASAVKAIASQYDNVDAREKEMRSRPALWQKLKRDVFPHLRKVSVEANMIIEEEMSDTTAVTHEPTLLTEQCIEDASVPVMATPVDTIDESMAEANIERSRDWHVSTNAIEWGMLIANAAGEWDFAPHWSARLSLHFSALNYFTSTRKFRTFIVRPELRYWMSGDSDRGLFFDGHLQMASYNFALSHWGYRIQDAGGKHPALGGGVGIGYRMPIGHNGRWALEGAIGGGVYHLKYNRYVNHIGGELIDTRSRTWLGLDNVALSIVYNFNTSSRK